MKAIRSRTFRYCDREVSGVKDVKDFARFELSLLFSRFFFTEFSDLVCYAQNRLEMEEQMQNKKSIIQINFLLHLQNHFRIF